MQTNTVTDSAFLMDTPSIRGPLFEYVRTAEFKRLFNQIVSAQEEMGFKVLAVVSEEAGEGKTFFASALALGYATLLNRNILLLDTIRQTSNRSLYLECIFGPPVGVLSRERRVHSGAIDLLTTKPREEVLEYRESTEFQIGTYVNSLKANYDLVIYDTCGLNEADSDNLDPVIIAKYADVVVLVNSRKALDYDRLNRLKRELKRQHIHHKLLGCVYNLGAP